MTRLLFTQTRPCATFISSTVEYHNNVQKIISKANIYANIKGVLHCLFLKTESLSTTSVACLSCFPVRETNGKV